jgi:hypothetical protein
MNFKNVGKKAEPTAEELEFIYQKIQEGLSDNAILADMQDESFDIRTKGFITRRRKEFNAAKRVLEDKAKKTIDPLLVKRREQHQDDLVKVIKQILKFWDKYLKGPQPVGGYDGLIVTDIELDQIDHHLAMSLLTHLQAEVSGLERAGGWKFMLYAKPSKGLFNLLEGIKNRRTFMGTCDICEDWE